MVFVSRHLSSLLVGTACLLGPSSFVLAQEAETPVDLTILSTNEENVSFVVVEEADNGSASTNVETVTTPADIIIEDNLTSIIEAFEAADNASESQGVKATTIASEPQATDDTASPSLTAELGQADASAAETEARAETAPTLVTRIERRTVKDVGLASIGIDKGSTTLISTNSLMWRGTDVARARLLIDKARLSKESDALRQMTVHIIAAEAVPPEGASEDPAALLQARMSFLAEAGRSDALAAIIRQLPEDEQWQEWRTWLVFYDLMMREDAKTCAQAAEQATQSLDPFWQQTHLVCQILTGNSNMAAFSADVLKASGLIEDDLFFALVDRLLGRDVPLPDYPEQLSLMHLILLDAAYIDVTAEQIAQIDTSYRQAVGSLRYMSDEARHLLTLANLQSGLVDQEAARQLFLAADRQSDDPLKAIARRLEAQTDSSSVQLYVALHKALSQQGAADNGTAETGASEMALFISQAFQREVAEGHGRLWLPFYAPLMKRALDDITLASLGADDQAAYAVMMALTDNALGAMPTDGGAIITADQVRVLRDIKSSDADRVAAAAALGLGDMVPLIAAEAVNQDWLTLHVEAVASSQPAYQPLSAFGLRAARKAAALEQVAEAALIISVALSQTALHQIAPRDMAEVIAILQEAGLSDVASLLRQEAIDAHIINRVLARS